MSRNGSLRIRLVSPIKKEVNGQIFREPGMSADFNQHKFTTNDANIIKMMRDMLKDQYRADYWNRLFQEMPTAATIKRMEDATRDIQTKIDKAREEAVGKEGVKKYEPFEKFKEQQKISTGKVVEGMRGLHNG